jgi:hypothetical protein
MKDVGSTMKMGKTILAARVLAVVAILALTVVPSCAPLCAGPNCGQAKTSATEDSCHGAAMTSPGGSQLRSLSLCNLRELPVAALQASNSRLSLESAGKRTTVLDFQVADRTVFSSLEKCFGAGSKPPSSLLSCSASARTEILRI